MKGLLYLITLACILVCAYTARPCEKGHCQKSDGTCIKKGKDEEQCVKTFCKKGKVVRQKFYGCRHNEECIKIGKLEEECSKTVCKRVKNETFHGIKKIQRFTGCDLPTGQCIAFGTVRNETSCVDSTCEKRRYGLKYHYSHVPYGCAHYGQCIPFGEKEEGCYKYTCLRRRNYKSNMLETVYRTEPLGCLENDVCIPFGVVEGDCKRRTCSKIEEKNKVKADLSYDFLGCRRNDTCVPFGTNEVNCRRITCTKEEDGDKVRTSYRNEPIGCMGANGQCYGPDDGPFPGVINGNTYDTCKCSYEDGIYKKTCTG